MKFLKAQSNKLSSAKYQLEVLEEISKAGSSIKRFEDSLQTYGMFPIK